MRHESDIDMNDTEFCTPAQAAEIRRMKAEFPLWQQVEAMKDSEGRTTVSGETHTYIEPLEAYAIFMPNDTVTNDATADATQALDGLETTIDTHNGQSSINAPTNVSSEFYPDNTDRPSWADYVAQIELHRALNNTEGMESEE